MTSATDWTSRSVIVIVNRYNSEAIPARDCFGTINCHAMTPLNVVSETESVSATIATHPAMTNTVNFKR